MKKEFVVIDADGNPSFSAKLERPEAFGTKAAAEKRAKELAKSEPGQTVGIYRLCAECVAEVSPPVVKPA